MRRPGFMALGEELAEIAALLIVLLASLGLSELFDRGTVWRLAALVVPLPAYVGCRVVFASLRRTGESGNPPGPPSST